MNYCTRKRQKARQLSESWQDAGETHQARRLAIGDIHGMFQPLQLLWQWVRPTSADRIVFLGDYVDRGRASKAVLNLLIQLHQNDEVQARFLLGNHERIMLDARHDFRMRDTWLRAGGTDTLMSYGVRGPEDVYNGSWIDFIPDDHWRFLEETCELYVEEDDVIYVHGGLDPGLDLKDHGEKDVLWRRHHGGPLHPCGKRVICGHTEQHGLLPHVDEGNIMADTLAHGGGPLTCISIDEQSAYQQFADGRRRELKWSDDYSIKVVSSSGSMSL